MTALKEYQRLETFGIWHASPTDQRRDVVVQLGEATLTISDARMTALSHWSLPAVVRLNPGETPAVFGPGAEPGEVLELDDETMIAAIEKVLASLRRRRRAQPHRLRRGLLIGAAAVALLGAALWLPGALIRQAVAVVPTAKRAELGAALLADMQRSAGAPCEGVLGRRALDRLRIRLLPDRQGSLIVLREGVAGAQYLPGGLVLLDRRLVEEQDDPAVLAGYVLAMDAAARQHDPLRRLLEDAGVAATLRLLATGGLSEGALAAHAEHLLTSPMPEPEPDTLAARFAAAEVPLGPWAAARGLDLSGAPLPAGARPVMQDSDWVALQGICAD